MPTTSTKDRRRQDRVTVGAPLRLTVPEGSEPATLKNLSVAGLSCTTGREFKELDRVKVTLDLPPLPGGEQVNVRLELDGAVVRCQPLRHGTGKRRFEAALYFTDLSLHAKQTLADLVRGRLA